MQKDHNQAPVNAREQFTVKQAEDGRMYATILSNGNEMIDIRASGWEHNSLDNINKIANHIASLLNTKSEINEDFIGWLA